MAGKQCPAERPRRAADESGPGVTLAGKVLCEHCDLGKGESCAPVLKAEGRDGYMKICPTSNDLRGLKKAAPSRSRVRAAGHRRAGRDRGNLVQREGGQALLSASAGL